MQTGDSDPRLGVTHSAAGRNGHNLESSTDRISCSAPVTPTNIKATNLFSSPASLRLLYLSAGDTIFKGTVPPSRSLAAPPPSPPFPLFSPPIRVAQRPDQTFHSRLNHDFQLFFANRSAACLTAILYLPAFPH